MTPFSPLGVWVLAARPKTLWAALSPVLVGIAFAQDRGLFHFPSATGALLGALLIQIGTNYANDYFDFQKGADTGDRLGPLRATQAGLVTPPAMLRATIVTFGLVALVSLYLIARAGWPILIIGVLAIASGILYTAGPRPLGYIGLGDLFVLVFFGPVAVGGTYYVQALQIDPIVILAGIAPGLMCVAILTVNNLRDVEQDRLAGKRTMAVRWGRSFARGEYILSIVVASVLPAGLGLATGTHPYAALTLVVFLLAVPVIKQVVRTTDGPALNAVLAQTGRLTFLHSVVFSLGWLL